MALKVGDKITIVPRLFEEYFGGWDGFVVGKNYEIVETDFIEDAVYGEDEHGDELIVYEIVGRYYLVLTEHKDKYYIDAYADTLPLCWIEHKEPSLASIMYKYLVHNITPEKEVFIALT